MVRLLAWVALFIVSVLPVAQAEDFIYWTERTVNGSVFESTIRRAKLDGSDMEIVFQTAGADYTSQVVGLAVDVANGYIYTGNNDWLFRLNLEGGDRVDLVQAFNPVANIRLDPIQGKIYWTEAAHSLNSIRRANLDGSNPETLASAGASAVYTIALDPAEKLYFFRNVNSGSDLIQSMNLDGTGVTTVYDLGGPDFDSDDLAIDLGRGKLYRAGFGETGIYQAALDGSTPYGLLFATPTGANGGIYFDAPTDRIFYFNGPSTAIEVANLDGSGRQVLVTGIALGMHIAVARGLCTDGLTFNGFLPPVGGADLTGGSFANPIRTFKMKSTIPLKFTLSCGQTPITEGVHFLQAVHWSNQTTAETPLDATPTDAATTGNAFRFSSGQWHFNLDTLATGMSVGRWQLIVTISDGSQHSVWIQLR